ncbi:hypothetical protein L1049_017309 [Liquidambar formosana]|uniref:ADP-ribosyl cyclase/cyclic ADP-ribose hydrolase n=1 Tax=Liquidambar formosana TaxID=63359 RepID=A0AAP0S0P1_LIQFO
MGGMGKTTIAKAVYNQLFSSFQDKCFLDVGIISEKPNGQVCLQETLLYEILKKKIVVSNVDRGINVIKERLCKKRVLVVVDNVDQLWQIEAVVGDRDWFGLGSRIIITTRHQDLLAKIKDDIYMLNGLNYFESLELFSWHAFNKSHPEEAYIELSNEVIGYCKGLPLALQLLGSLLYDRSKPEWKSQLEKLRRTPPDDIQKKLRISYDALEDNERNIFLDIACFFIGVNTYYAVRILDGCGFFPKIGISVLVQRCLLNINGKNELTMHDLLRDMGRRIVREEFPKEPKNCSRLWFYDDVLDILVEHKGTEAVEGLVAKLPKSNVLSLSTKAFAKMHRLRLLQLNNVHHIEGNDNIFKQLKCLRWHAFPLKFIPKKFHVENLVDIDMQYSMLRQLWKEIKVLGKLKFLDLSHSHYLTETPNFLQLPKLEKLILEDCTRLVKVHLSIGHLDRLVLVNMRGCTRLQNLPRSICRLKSLKILHLSGCSKLEKFPEDLGEMEALIELPVDGTAIRQIPLSIVRLKNLRNLSLCGCKGSLSSSLASVFRSAWISPRRSLDPISLLPSSLLGLSSLTRLSLEDCNLSDIPKDLDCLSFLRDLDLRSNNFRSLTASISNLPRLKYLKLGHCTRLESLTELPTSLMDLYAPGCISLERLPNFSKFKSIPFLFLPSCSKLVGLPGLGKPLRIDYFLMAGYNNLENTFKESLLRTSMLIPQPAQYSCHTVFPGNEIPHWFHYQGTGTSLSFQLPPMLGCKISGFYICINYGPNINHYGPFDIPQERERKMFPPVKYSIPLDSTQTLLHISCFNKTKHEAARKNKNILPETNPDLPGTPRFMYDVEIPTQDQVSLFPIMFPFYSWSASWFDGGDQLEFKACCRDDVINVKKVGIRFICAHLLGSRHLDSDHGELFQCNIVSNENAMVVGHDEDTFEDQTGSKAKTDRGDDEAGVGPSHCWSGEDPNHEKLAYQIVIFGKLVHNEAVGSSYSLDFTANYVDGFEHMGIDETALSILQLEVPSSYNNAHQRAPPCRGNTLSLESFSTKSACVVLPLPALHSVTTQKNSSSVMLSSIFDGHPSSLF